jgi:hypothetical protein
MDGWMDDVSFFLALPFGIMIIEKEESTLQSSLNSFHSPH